MDCFNFIAGVCSIVGLVISIMTLYTTRSAKRAIKSYRFSNDCAELMRVLKGASESLTRDSLSFDPIMLYNCLEAVTKLKLIWGSNFEEETINKIKSLGETLVRLRDHPKDSKAQSDAKTGLLEVSVLIERSISNGTDSEHGSFHGRPGC